MAGEFASAERQPPRRAVTVLEPVEEVRARVRRTAQEVAPLISESAKEGVKSPPQKPACSSDDTQPYRPTQRPPMALLTVLDDADTEGETIRIRGDSLIIGRVEGSLILPHDGAISSRHAEISRRREGDTFRWYLRDLQSTNGTFVGASSAILQDGQEVLIGVSRLRFEAAKPPADASGSQDQAGATRKWQTLDPKEFAASLFPSLVELVPGAQERRHQLTETETWIGRDRAQASVVLANPMVSPRHARVFRDDRGRWLIQNHGSMNGLWLRIDEIHLDCGGHFLCGEQRFVMRVL
jgi:pSer/pThr/pTyr-binding forkhead associated (FHA) protein